MTNAVSPFHTSIQMDVSGIKMATDRGAEYVATFADSAIRSGQALQDAASDTRDWSDSMRRAASMVELLTAKTLQMQSTIKKTSQAFSGSTFGDQMASTQPRFGDRMAGVNGEQQRANEARIAAEAAAIRREHHDIRMRDNVAALARERAVEESERAQSFAALRADIEQRAALQRQYDEIRVRDAATSLARERAVEESERAQSFAALRADIEQRAALQRQYDEIRVRDAATSLARERAVEESERAQSFAALRADIEQRARIENEAADRRRASAIRAEQRYQQDANRFRNGATGGPFARMDAGNISENFRSIAREAVLWERGREAQESAERSLRNMRAMLNPMVEMENRLADEAEAFRINMELAVRSGRMNNVQAQQLTTEFQQQNALLMARAQQEQAGFLGMRRMGFAAQQLGYAVEDAASMYGTMGLAGAFRAAGNNLTAMAATAGPVVGVTASIAAAVAAIGLHWWESKKASDEAAKSQEEVLDIQQRILATEERLIRTTTRLNELRAADKRSIFGATLSDQQQASGEAEAKAATEARMAPLRNAEARLAAITARMNAMGPMPMASGPMGAAGSADFQRRQNEYINERVALITEQRSLEADIVRLKQEANEADQINNSEARKAQERQRERIDGLARSQQLYDSRLDEIRNPNRQESIRNFEKQIADIAAERTNLLERAYQSESDLVQALRMQEELMDRQLETEERLARFREEQRENERGLNRDIMARYESMNDELRFINEITSAREKLNEEIARGVRAGTMDPGQAAALRQDFNDQIAREIANRDAAEGIRQRQARISDLESQLSGMTPAQVMGGMARGTDETRRFLEAERLRQQSVNDQEPVVAEIQGLRQQVRQLQAVMERNANAAPQAAEIF